MKCSPAVSPSQDGIIIKKGYETKAVLTGSIFDEIGELDFVKDRTEQKNNKYKFLSRKRQDDITVTWAVLTNLLFYYTNPISVKNSRIIFYAIGIALVNTWLEYRYFVLFYSYLTEKLWNCLLSAKKYLK